MKIQLIGFDFDLNPNYKINLVKEIVNGSDADLILFPGHTLRDYEDLVFVEGDITNEKSTVVIEMTDAYPTSCLHLHNALFLIKEGFFEDMLPVCLVVGREFHYHAASCFYRREFSAEHF